MKGKMKKKLIAFLLCMVLVVCNSVSILADTPAETTTVEQQAKETRAAKEGAGSEEDKDKGDGQDISVQSEESEGEKAPEVKTTEKKEDTAEASTEKEESTTEASTEKKDSTTAAGEDTTKTDKTTEATKEETTEAEEETSTTEKKEETTGADEKKTTEAAEETSETFDKKDTEKTTEAEKTTAPTELTYEDENVTVTVSAVAEGAIPADTTFKVVPILKNDTETKDQYAEVEAKIQEKAAETETEIKGFLAYDITFVDADGNEVEPNSEVKVSMEYKEAALPAEITAEDVEDAEVSVMHLEEDDAGNVAEVVDMGEAGKVDTLETTDAKQVEKVEVKTESFSVFTLAWSVEKVSAVNNRQNTERSNNENALFDSIAEDYMPSSNSTNDWQIVSGEYDGHGDDTYTVTDDGMFRLQKKVIPTGTENEFYIYLNMEPVMSWEEVFKQSTIWLCNNNWTGDISSLTEEMTASQVKEQSGGHVSRLVSEEIPLDDKLSTQPKQEEKVHTIRLETSSGNYEEFSVDMHYGLSQQSSDSFTILYCAPNSDQFVKLSNISRSEGVLTIPAEAWGQMVSGSETGDLSLLTGTVVPDQVTDTMGDYIEYRGEASATNGKATYDPETKTLTWNDFTELPDSEDENDFALYKDNYYRKNAYQLVYKVRLDVTKEGFTSCAEELFDSETIDASHYATNQTTQLDYTINASENGQGDFESPVVKGLLYDVEFQKVDEAGVPLSGAKFQIKGEHYGEEITETAASDDKGYVKFRNLPHGTYQLTETNPPTGYTNSYEDEDITLCYTTNPDDLEQDHADPHKVDQEEDIRNALLKSEKIGKDGKIVNQSEGINPGPGPDNPSEVPIKKQIDWLGNDGENPDTELDGDYYYRLYLDATGIPDKEPEGADIVFVLDMSNSMRFDMKGNGDVDNGEDPVPANTWRLNYVKDAATQAIQTIKETCSKQNVNNINIGLVTFNYGNSAHKSGGNTTYEKGTKILSDFTNDYDSLINTIEGLGAQDLNSRTNYEAAFAATDSLLKTSGQANKYVVFITDGETNGYTDGGTGFEGNGTHAEGTEKYTDPSGENGNRQSLNQAQAIASEWTNLKGFYTIAVSEDIKSEVLKNLGPSKVTRLDLQANDEDAINEAFSTVVSAITKQVCDVTITDQLSEYVEFVNESGKTFTEQDITSPAADNIALKVTKTVDEETTKIDPDDYTVTIDANTKKVTVNFGEDYFLEPEAVYTISFNVKLTEQAFTDSMEDTGDEGTDYGTNNTSSGQKGHFSNDTAEVTYSTVTDGKLTEHTKKYDRPVVQPNGGTAWRIIKKSDTPDSNLYLVGAEFQLLQGDAVKYTGVSIEDNTSTTDINEKGFIQWKENGEEIDETDILAGTYILKEIKAPDGYSLSSTTWEITIKHMEASVIYPLDENGKKGTPLNSTPADDGTYEFIITNTALYDLPSAGGPGIYWYTLSGTLLMAGAALIVYRQKRKQEVLLRK